MNTFLSIFIGFWAVMFFFGGFYMGTMLWVMGQAGIQSSSNKDSPKNKKFSWQLNAIFVIIVTIGLGVGYYLWSWASYFWNLS